MNRLDLEKLIFQAVFGIDHLLSRLDRFEADLAGEWSVLSGDPITSPPMLQVIDPAGRTARLHLYPCKRMSIQVDNLVQVLTAQDRKGGKVERFNHLLAFAEELRKEGRVPGTLGSRPAGEDGVGIPHHSSGYGHTAYRVVNSVESAAFCAWNGKACSAI